MSDSANCGHLQDPDDAFVCLIPDGHGGVHRAWRVGQHCQCCGWPIGKLDWFASRRHTP